MKKQFNEWDFERRQYARQSRVVTKKPLTENIAQLKRFDGDFRIIPTVMSYSFKGWRAEKRMFERRSRRVGKLNTSYVIDNLAQAYKGGELSQDIYDVRNNAKMMERRHSQIYGVLFDMSGSTRFKVDDRYTRIDLIKFATLAFGRILAELDEPFFVYGYHTSRDADPTIIEKLKTFNEGWSSTIESRIAAVDHTASTEFFNNKDGAAIRYVTEKLHTDNHAKKYVILVTDGFPNCDDTYYEGEYAFSDTAKAMEEGKADKIGYVYLTISPDDAGNFMGHISPHSIFARQFRNMNDVVEGLPLAYEILKKI
jgi:nitric oxide reductase activation protein